MKVINQSRRYRFVKPTTDENVGDELSEFDASNKVSSSEQNKVGDESELDIAVNKAMPRSVRLSKLELLRKQREGSINLFTYNSFYIDFPCSY